MICIGEYIESDFTTMRIATWNIPYAFRTESHSEAWRYYIEQISADYYLANEVRPPEWVLSECDVVWSEIGNWADWGSAVVSPDHGVDEVEIDSELRGAMMVAESTYSSDFEITLISWYGLFEELGDVGYSTPNLHRMLSDLTGLLDGKTHGQRTVVLGGDLNTSPQWDKRSNRDTNRILFDRLEDFGLTNCFDLFYDDYVQTYRPARGDTNWQNDYFFISDNLTDNIQDCEVIESQKVREFSDHNPVIITLDVG